MMQPHDNRFRTYDPDVGRYISADPIGQAGGVNVFRFAKNSPMNWIDPLGLDVVINFGKPATYYHEWVTVGGTDPRRSGDAESFGAYPEGSEGACRSRRRSA